jgi:hypothetical protein
MPMGWMTANKKNAAPKKPTPPKARRFDTWLRILGCRDRRPSNFLMSQKYKSNFGDQDNQQ